MNLTPINLFVCLFQWRLELNRYCSGKIAGQIDLQCCQSNDPFGCFQTVSLDPLYNKTSEKEAPALSTMCDTKIFTDNRYDHSMLLALVLSFVFFYWYV